jgi:O-antigen ligase
LISSLWVVARGELTADGRAMGFTTEPNLLGHQAVLMGGLAGLLLKPHWAKGLVLLGAGLMVFLSGSRGSLLALVPLGIAWWWGLGSQGRIKILAIAIFMGASILLSKVNLGHLANSFDLQANSSKIRLEVWKVALERIKHNPIIGLGQTGFVPYYLQHRPPNALSPWIGHTHNVFLQLWVEAGLLGLLGFVVLWSKVAWEVWHRKNTAAGLLLLAAIVLNLVDYTWFYSGVYYPLWVAMAWMINLDEQAAS